MAQFSETELDLIAQCSRLKTALKPFADAVYNDNGDMTVTPCGREAYIAAFFAMRSLSSQMRTDPPSNVGQK